MNQRTRHRRHVWLLLFAILACAVIVCAALFITGGGSFHLRSTWRKLFASMDATPTATEFSYARAEDAFFAPVGSGLAIGDGDGVRCIDGTGEETVLTTEQMRTPVGDFNGTECLIYDLRGSFLCVLDASGLLWQAAAPGALFGCSLNAAGWVCACSEYDGYHGAVTVYNAAGEAVYRWYCGSGYPVSADLSSGCDGLAVLTVGAEGSKIHFLRLDSETELACYTAEDTVLLDIRYARPELVTAISGEGLCTVSTDGVLQSSLLWDGSLSAYTFSGDGYIAAAWARSSLGTAGGLETVDTRGEVLSRLELTGDVVSVSAAGKYIAVRYTDRVAVYNKRLEPIYETAGMANAVDVLALEDGSFFAVGETSAELYGK